MDNNSIIIIGAGMGHLFGCNDFSRIYGLWHEMGAMPRELVYTDDCVSVVSPEGRLFKDYYDLEKLERHLKELSQADAPVIDDYIKGIKSQAKQDYFGDFAFGGIRDLIKVVPYVLANLGWFKPNMEDFAGRFSDPFLRKAFPLLEYSLPHAPFFLHLIKHAYGYRKSIAWPVGGDKEKQKIAGQVIEQLSHYFKGIESQIEVVDVATLMTWEKFMSGTNGFNNFPVKKASFTASLLSRKLENTLPGLANFYMVGAWTTSLGATFMNAFSGKKAIQAVCKEDGKKFTS